MASQEPCVVVHIQCTVLENLVATNTWWRALSFPLSHLPRYCPRPYKWITFVCYAILATRGKLFASQDQAPLDLQTLATANILSNVYFIPSDSYTITPNAAALASIRLTRDRDSSTNASQQSGRTQTRIAQFRERVKARDGNLSVFTGHDMVQGAHLLPHAKGDPIIGGLTRQLVKQLYDPAAAADNHPDIITDIDDIRNGMTFPMGFYATFAKETAIRTTAILVTPNFELDTADLNPPFDWSRHPDYSHPILQQTSAATLRTQRDICYTVHHIRPDDWDIRILNYDVPHGADAAKIPINYDERPSKLILDTIYGAMILAKYGLPDFQNFVNGTSFILDEVILEQPEPEGSEMTAQLRRGRGQGQQRSTLDGVLAMFQLRSIIQEMEEETAKERTVLDWVGKQTASQ
ncbi:hypothetical protein C8J56DRAFT_499184 [Mycena floridula]|nr:hypothetical protein C8J56DRAFT_499184 [Mycena floridula]